MAKSKRDYNVGYKKPPTHTRFKKGQSGNPVGRPKGKIRVADLDTVIDEVASALIAVNENGRASKISKIRALVTSEFNKALKGHQPSVKTIFSTLGKRRVRVKSDSLITSRTAEESKNDFEEFLNGIAARSSNAGDSTKPQNDTSTDDSERDEIDEPQRNGRRSLAD